jgi:type IV pilus assembly protein PilV
MKRPILLNQKGFSLLEALIAMMIVTVGLLAVGLMQIGAMKGNTNAISRSDGVAMAQSVMDVLRTLPLDDDRLDDNGNALDAGESSPPDATAADHGGDEIFAANPVAGSNGQTYTVFWNVVDDDPVDNAKTVRVYVYWNDNRFGLNRAVMTTVVGGLYL